MYIVFSLCTAMFALCLSTSCSPPNSNYTWNYNPLLPCVALSVPCAHAPTSGQMVWLEDVDHILFIGSPRLSSLSDLEDRQLYLSDIPLYDVTRELVLLNQQRIAELEVR